MSKKSLVTLIVAIVFVVGVVYLFGRSSQQPQAITPQEEQKSNEVSEIIDGKNTLTTYSNGIYGYTLKYPKTWVLSEAEEGGVYLNFPLASKAFSPTTQDKGVDCALLIGNAGRGVAGTMSTQQITVGGITTNMKVWKDQNDQVVNAAINLQKPQAPSNLDFDLAIKKPSPSCYNDFVNVVKSFEFTALK